MLLHVCVRVRTFENVHPLACVCMRVHSNVHVYGCMRPCIDVAWYADEAMCFLLTSTSLPHAQCLPCRTFAPGVGGAGASAAAPPSDGLSLKQRLSRMWESSKLALGLQAKKGAGAGAGAGASAGGAGAGALINVSGTSRALASSGTMGFDDDVAVWQCGSVTLWQYVLWC
jgi:hypothetical protein